MPICYPVAMNDPVRRRAATWLGASIVFLILVVGGLWLRSPTAAPPPPAVPRVPVTPAAAPAAVAKGPLLRSDLIEAGAAAADAYASGTAQPAANRELIGRAFEYRAVFGCAGPSPSGSSAAMRWEYDAEEGVVRVTVRSEQLSDLPGVRAIVGDTGVDAVEGLWVERPWLRSATCPRLPTPLDTPVSLAAPRETLAIGELFAPDEPRSLRRQGRPYEAVAKMTPDAVAALRGFALVVEGRIEALPSGEPAGCWGTRADLAPTCLIAVSFERVRLENAASGEVLNEWHR